MRTTLSFAAIIVSAAAASRVTPPIGSLVVCQEGCQYAKIQDAVSALANQSSIPQSIFIHGGTYNEQVIIPSYIKSKLNIYGFTLDTSSYEGNVVNLEWNSSRANGAASDKLTATLINLAANVTMSNINIRNKYGRGSQAVALATYNNRQAYYAVGIYGFQDTLFAQKGVQLFASCFIEGAIDFIFGAYSQTWITNTTISVKSAGCITANGRSSESNSSYFVIDKSVVTTSLDYNVSAGRVFLGRPWRDYARVCFQQCTLPDVINSAGWQEWSPNEPKIDHVIFQEYGNSGPGASGKRASFATQITSAINISTILGSDYADWVDASYL